MEALTEALTADLVATGSKHALMVLAGGSGSRMGAGVNKQLLTLGGDTITEITLKQLINCKPWHQIILVAAQKDWQALSDVVQKVSNDRKVTIHQVAGGSERQHSVLAGVQALDDHIETVWIHDGARPFIEAELVERLDMALKTAKAVIPALPSKDTLKEVSFGFVIKTIDRSEIYRIQTPQCFEKKTLLLMQQLATEVSGFTDDASMAEALGIQVQVVPGSEWNIKLTTPEDLVLGAAIYEYLKGEGKCV